MLVANWVRGHIAEHNFPLKAGASQHSFLQVTLVLLPWDIIFLNVIFLGSHWPLNQSRSSLWTQTYSSTRHHCPSCSCKHLCKCYTSWEEGSPGFRYGKPPRTVDTAEQCKGPVIHPLVQCFIYISCGRKWEKGRGNTTLQMSAKPHSAFSALTQSSKYFLQWLIFLQNPARHHSDDFCFRVL